MWCVCHEDNWETCVQISMKFLRRRQTTGQGIAASTGIYPVTQKKSLGHFFRQLRQKLTNFHIFSPLSSERICGGRRLKASSALRRSFLNLTVKNYGNCSTFLKWSQKKIKVVYFFPRQAVDHRPNLVAGKLQIFHGFWAVNETPQCVMDGFWWQFLMGHGRQQ